MTEPTIHDRVREYLRGLLGDKKKWGTRKAFGEAVGWDESQVSQYFKEGSDAGLPLERMAKAASYFRLTLPALLANVLGETDAPPPLEPMCARVVRVWPKMSSRDKETIYMLALRAAGEPPPDAPTPGTTGTAPGKRPRKPSPPPKGTRRRRL